MVEKLVTPRPGSCSVCAGACAFSALSLKPIVPSALAFPPSPLSPSLPVFPFCSFPHSSPSLSPFFPPFPDFPSLPSFLASCPPGMAQEDYLFKKGCCTLCMLGHWLLLLPLLLGAAGYNWNPPGLTLSPEPLEERVTPSDVHIRGGLCPQDSLPEAPQ